MLIGKLSLFLEQSQRAFILFGIENYFLSVKFIDLINFLGPDIHRHKRNVSKVLACPIPHPFFLILPHTLFQIVKTLLRIPYILIKRSFALVNMFSHFNIMSSIQLYRINF